MVEQLQPTTVQQNSSETQAAAAAQNSNNQAAIAGDPDAGKNQQAAQFADQERFLPIANINRIMKNALPSDTKISKEARECVQECVSEFIAFITCESCEITQLEKRKTINGEDVIKAMENLNFVQYLELIEFYNRRYKDILKKNEGKDVDINSDAMSQGTMNQGM